MRNLGVRGSEKLNNLRRTMELVRGQTYFSNYHRTPKLQCHLHGHSQTSVNKTPIKALDPELT